MQNYRKYDLPFA